MIKNSLPSIIDKFCQPTVAYPNLSYSQLVFRQIKHAKGFYLFISIVNSSRIFLLLCLSFLLMPIALILHFLGIRFISVDLSQVGSIVYLDQILRYNALNGRTNSRLFFVARSHFSESNSTALDLYKDKVTYLYSPFIKLLASPFFMNPYLQENSFKFDTAATFISDCEERIVIAHDVQQSYSKRFLSPIAKLNDDKCEEAMSEILEFVPIGAKFVTVHVRDSGFYSDPERSTRNGSIHSYELAFRYLIQQGYYIFRMGDSSMVPISDMVERCGPRLIDYAHSKIRSPLIDCFLISKCDFFIGLASGIWALAIVFEKPTVLVNFYSAATGLGFGPNDLTTFKNLRYIADDSLVPFETQLRPPYSHNPGISILKKNGVYLAENSPDEILATIKEFLEFFGKKPSPLQNYAKQKILPTNFCWNGAGNFSRVSLEKYYPCFNKNTPLN